MKLEFQRGDKDGDQIDVTIAANTDGKPGGERAFGDVLFEIREYPFGLRLVVFSGPGGGL